MAPVDPAERGPKPAGTGRPSYALRITQVTIQERGQALVFDLAACRRLDSGEYLVGAPGRPGCSAGCRADPPALGYIGRRPFVYQSPDMALLSRRRGIPVVSSAWPSEQRS